MKDGAGPDQQQSREDEDDDAAASKPKEKKQKTATKPGEGDAQDPSAAAAAERDPDDAAASNGIIIGTNPLAMDMDEDDSSAAPTAADCTSVVKHERHIGQRGEDDVLRAWQAFSSQGAVASRELCEALRLILEPTLASKMHGDFKTGKRINMRKVTSPHPPPLHPAPSPTEPHSNSLLIALARSYPT
jgi:midasin